MIQNLKRLVLFIAYLVDTEKKSSTIKSYIKAVLIEDGVIINEDRYLLSAMVKACRLQNDQVHTRLPVKRYLLDLLLDQTTEYYDSQLGQHYLAFLYRALFAAGYYGLLRVGEMTTGTHPVFATDVQIGTNKKKITFTLHMSKTHWRDVKPQTIKITNTVKPHINQAMYWNNRKNNTTQEKYCPYKILQDYATLRPTCTNLMEPFFVFRDRTPVKPSQMRKALRNGLQRLGLDCSLYDTHSLCAGHAVDLFDLGFDLSIIKKLGQWQSNSVFTYLKKSVRYVIYVTILYR